MKNTFGSNISVTVFGESHGEYIGAVIDGLAPGIEINKEYIDSKLALRRPQGEISTSRVEKDEYIIASGVFEGKTTGTPICALIPNTDTKSKDYSKTRFKARPGHADFAAFCKYHGFEDYRGGGHFSGRITAALVLAGAIIMYALEQKGIYIGTHIKSIENVSDREFEDIPSDIAALSKKSFAVLGDSVQDKMTEAVTRAKADGDSVGGVLETAVIGIPAGVGEPFFDSVESMLAHAMFSIPAVKGIEFGAGFDITKMRGSEANDEFYITDGIPATATNNNGGINGGITNGMPIIFRTAIKPTPTIFKTQHTVDFSELADTELTMQGRHDPCIVHRARVVQDCACAIVLADLLTGRFGTDFLGE
ncbi:MAG: chorismate synthase [Clostridia bacterium]|nr:chorismate synthase [Clostridia bacterium]